MPLWLIIRLLVSGHQALSLHSLRPWHASFELDRILFYTHYFSIFQFVPAQTFNWFEFTIYFSTTQLRRCSSVERSLTTWWTRVKHCPCSLKPSTKLREKPTVVVVQVGANYRIDICSYHIQFALHDTRYWWNLFLLHADTETDELIVGT